jgi:DNA-binding PadR family transcriptional regulator
MSKMSLTVKQVELLTVIAKGNGAAAADLDEILDRIRYETTKQSLQFSIRALIKHGFIEKRGTEKRRGRQRQMIAATDLGLSMVGMKPASAVSIIESDDDTIVEEVLE